MSVAGTAPGRLWAPGALVLAVVLAYAGAMAGPFQFDDYSVIVDFDAVQSWAAWAADLPRGIRPLLKLTYTANWTAGWGAAGFHAVNVAIHAVNALLVWRLAARLLAPGAALAAAALFALHPVQTEAVTYISGRSTSLMTLFYLAAVLAYARGGRVWTWLAAPAAFLAAVAVKEVAVTLPAALLLWEMAQQPRRPGLLVRQAPFWAILAALAVALVLHPRYGPLLVMGYGLRDAGANLLGQAELLPYLLSRLVVLDRLPIDPDLVPAMAWGWEAMAGLAVTAAGVALGVANLRARPWLGFGLLWFLLHLLPTNSLVPRFDWINMRQLYLPGIGLFLIAGSLLARLPVGRRTATAALMAVLAAFTLARNADYASEVGLWWREAQLSPGNPRVWTNLGYAYRLSGCRDAAESAYRRALLLDPNYRPASDNLEALASVPEPWVCGLAP